MKRKITAILITAIITAMLSGCMQAATTANINVGAVAEPETASVFALSPEPTATPVVTYVPEEIAELQAEAAAITLPAQPSPLPEEAEEEQPVPEESITPEPDPTKTPEPTEKPEPTKQPEATKEPEATKKPEETKKPEYTVTDVEDQEGYVYAKSVNLRSGPGTSYDIVREYDQYRELTVTGKSGDWYAVTVGSREGFMLKEYVKLGEVPKATPKPTATPEPTPEPAPEETPAVEETPAPEITPAPTEPPKSDMPSSGSYTSDELYLLAQLVYKEGDGPSYVAVANVILNRINSSKFPNTVEGVVYQKSQFSTSNLKTPSSAAKDAVTAVFVNGQTVLPSNVYYFRTASSWSGHELYGKIGGNYFYY